MPDTFALWLRDDGSVYRECKVVWREGDVLGVQFRVDERKQASCGSAIASPADNNLHHL